MSNKMLLNKRIIKKTALGGILENPVFVLVLGMCPTIKASTNITDAFALGIATTFVLICSNVIISLFRKFIPDQVRLPAYIVIIATFVTIVQLFLASLLPDLNQSIGPIVAMIVVNCIVLGRAESFASKNSVLLTLIDCTSMGIGFTLSLLLMGAIRQGLIALNFSIFSTTAGGFLVLGLLMALFNFIMMTVEKRKMQKSRAGLNEEVE